MSIFPGKVVLATDGSAEAELASRSAVELADKTGSELHIVHVWSPPLYYHPERHSYHAHYEQQREEARHLLGEQVEGIRRSGGSVAEAHFADGVPDEEIVKAADNLDAGLVVTGSRGLGGIRRTLLGSVSEVVVRHAHCSVLVVRTELSTTQTEVEETSIFPTKILVATDGSLSSARALREAVELARDTDSELHIVHVVPVSTLYSSADMVLAGGGSPYTTKAVDGPSVCWPKT
ncbi:hypothetical protein BH23ACT11_BH23ACT11_04920 [soil metagenome]